MLGYVVPEIFRFPGELATGLKFADIPNGIAAINVIPSQVSWAMCYSPHLQLTQDVCCVCVAPCFKQYNVVLDCNIFRHWGG